MNFGRSNGNREDSEDQMRRILYTVLDVGLCHSVMEKSLKSLPKEI